MSIMLFAMGKRERVRVRIRGWCVPLLRGRDRGRVVRRGEVEIRGQSSPIPIWWA